MNPIVAETNDVYEQRNNFALLRMKVYHNLEVLGISIKPLELARLLGHESYDEMKYRFSQQDVAICRALAGPHGFTIYKMLLARKCDDR